MPGEPWCEMGFASVEQGRNQSTCSDSFWAVFLSSNVKFPGCEPAQYLGYCHPLASANCFQQQSLLSSHCNIYWIAGPWSYTQICVNSFCLCITTVGVRRVRQEPGQKLSCFLPLTCCLWWIQRNCRVSCPHPFVSVVPHFLSLHPK